MEAMLDQGMLIPAVASAGKALGRLIRWESPECSKGSVMGAHALSEQDERLRFEKACEQLKEELLAQISSGGLEAEILEAHLLMLEDDLLKETVESYLVDTSASQAVLKASDDLCALFAEVDDPYLKERVSDIRDVCKRLESFLLGKQGRREISEGDEDVILASESLSPSELIRMNKSRIKGILLKNGSPLDHVSILARNYKIPMATGLGTDFNQLAFGEVYAIDTQAQRIYRNPDLSVWDLSIRQFPEQRDDHKRDWIRSLKGRVKLYANANSEDDIARAITLGAEAIGLYRSEFHFMSLTRMPSSEELSAHTQALIQAARGKELTIRTLDIGGDKHIAYLPDSKGLSGISYQLYYKDLLKDQLRAIAEAASVAQVRLLLPQVYDVYQVREVKALWGEMLKERPLRVGAPFDCPIGVMVETRAAVDHINDLLQEVDFISIGTNDLTAELLGLDRYKTEDLVYKGMSEEVMKALELCILEAVKRSVPCGVCGELAAYPPAAEKFIQMGVNYLSMSFE